MKPKKNVFLWFILFITIGFNVQASDNKPTVILLPGIKNSNSNFYWNFSIVGDPIVSQMISSGNVNNQFGLVHIFSKLDNLSQHKAIIIATKEDDNDVLWEEANMCGNFAYQVLQYQGYHPQNIYYFSSDTDSTLVNDFASSENLYQLLTSNWALTAKNLVIYMVGHGGVERNQLEKKVGYFVMGQNDLLYADVFDGYLDQLQGENQQLNKLVLIYDSCHSGSFISNLGDDNNLNRSFLTSSSDNEPAAFMNRGGLSFSYQFWSKIFNGGTLYESFLFAKNMMAAYQNPLIDTNGNGIPDEYNDIDLADHIVIGKGRNYAIHKPSIAQVCNNITLKGAMTANFWVTDVLPLNKVDHVWAVIIPPDLDYMLPDNPITDHNLDHVELMDNNNDRMFEGTYHLFDTPGVYRIACYASYPYVQDNISRTIYSNPVFITVTQSGHVVSIADVTPDMALTNDTQITLWAENVISQENDIDRVWAVVHSPVYQDHQFESSQSENLEITLVYNTSLDRYQINYNDFPNYGVYHFYVYAQDNDGNLSLPTVVTVRNKMGPDVYESDDTPEEATTIIINNKYPQLHNFHHDSDEDWMIFYGIAGIQYTFETYDVDVDSDTQVSIFKADASGSLTLVINKNDQIKGKGEEFDWSCEHTGIYYVKINQYYPLTTFENTGYSFRMYNPFADLKAEIKGWIYDANHPEKTVYQASIKTNNGGSAISSKSGYFIILSHDIGEFTLSVNARNYMPYSMDINISQENATDCIRVEIFLKPAPLDNYCLDLKQGLNVISYPVETSSEFISYSLLELIGQDHINRITYYEGTWLTASFFLNSFSGKKFVVNETSGLVIYMNDKQSLSLSGNKKCSSVNLSPGFNLAGINCPPDNLSSYELFEQLGGCNDVEKISKHDGKWLTTSCFLGQVSGQSFTIVHGEGYLIYMKKEKLNFKP